MDADLFAWMGDAALFVRGTSLESLDGALVVESTNDDRAAAAFGKIVALVSKQAACGRPEADRGAGGRVRGLVRRAGRAGGFVLARGKGRVVVALRREGGGRRARDGSTLESTDLWKGAETVLGDDYSPRSCSRCRRS